MIKDLVTLFDRDLDKLAEEVKSYSDEKQIWQVKGEIKNSAGNLCLHLVGNLNHFFGAIIGKTGYVRNRKTEFSIKDISAAELINEIQHAKNVVIKTLNNIGGKDLEAIYPVPGVRGPNEYRPFHSAPLWALELPPRAN